MGQGIMTIKSRTRGNWIAYATHEPAEVARIATLAKGLSEGMTCNTAQICLLHCSPPPQDSEFTFQFEHP